MQELKKRLQKAEMKQFAQASRGKDEWDREYDRGKQRKTQRKSAKRNSGWGKAATVQNGSMSDKF